MYKAKHRRPFEINWKTWMRWGALAVIVLTGVPGSDDFEIEEIV